ncbi:sugar ABC transporter substrate-binding protein, partial [Mesorhizobium sp. M5C.F.Ca.ET.164.01.1.1]
MKDRNSLTLSVTISRWTLMVSAAAGAATLAMPKVLRAADKPTLVTSIRLLS